MLISSTRPGHHSRNSDQARKSRRQFHCGDYFRIPYEGDGTVAVGDFNNDGKLDFAVNSINSNAGLKIYLGNANGTFNAGVTLSTSSRHFRNVDFFGRRKRDGKVDLISVIGGANYVPPRKW